MSDQYFSVLYITKITLKVIWVSGFLKSVLLPFVRCEAMIRKKLFRGK